MSARDFLTQVGHLWDLNLLLSMETKILKELQFDINVSPVSTFLENYSRAI